MPYSKRNQDAHPAKKRKERTQDSDAQHVLTHKHKASKRSEWADSYLEPLLGEAGQEVRDEDHPVGTRPQAQTSGPQMTDTKARGLLTHGNKAEEHAENPLSDELHVQPSLKKTNQKPIKAHSTVRTAEILGAVQRRSKQRIDFDDVRGKFTTTMRTTFSNVLQGKIDANVPQHHATYLQLDA